ncbi:acyl-CoA thioesterase [Luteibacter sp. UNCMF366Tsu5.1]|uniref:acyl-CoA thioesterase n=1 Tax=Luteibacter sp. UNCMF366Tsu5.1 TaxID=1502758 RepID=UPI00090892A6|nr:acyl-CoA thioesterase [Luteibacter sp. UNCMF366Tsu5.1]SFW34411.1 acyl-CoA thioester hydrolase [Luteibacter sp. UNCMF366Tsu5.1]
MRAKGVYATEIDLVVPFFDVDSMEVVWHGHYVKYFEVARCVLLDELGHNYVRMKDAGYVWPIIDLQVRYARAARFGQALRVRAELVEWQNRLKIHYTVSDAATGERLTRGSTVQVAVSLANGEMQLVSPAVFVDDIERQLAAASSLPAPGTHA